MHTRNVLVIPIYALIGTHNSFVSRTLLQSLEEHVLGHSSLGVGHKAQPKPQDISFEQNM